MDRTEEPLPVAEPLAKAPKKKSNTGRTIIVIVVVLVVLAAIGFALWGMSTHPAATSVVRDIAIIILALVTIVIGLFLAILIFQLQSLIAMLRDEVRPILNSTQETVRTVKGTTSFVSDNVVSPMVNIMSLVAGIGGTARALVRGPSKNGRHRSHKS